MGGDPAARSAHTTSRNWDLINQLPLRELQSRILRLSCSELKLSQRLRFRNSIQGRGRNVPGFVGIPSWTRELSCRVQLLVTFRVLGEENIWITSSVSMEWTTHFMLDPQFPVLHQRKLAREFLQLSSLSRKICPKSRPEISPGIRREMPFTLKRKKIIGLF